MANKRSRLKNWFQLCPVRHVLTLVGLLMIGAYFLFRSSTSAMRWIYEYITAPLHRALAGLCDHVFLSVGEVLIVLVVLLVLGYLIWAVARIVQRKHILAGLYGFFLSDLRVFALI